MIKINGTQHYKAHIVGVLATLFMLLAWQPATAQAPKQEVEVVGDKNYPEDSRIVYDGIDVSAYQHDIDWRTTASDKNIKFVYIKATEGATHVSRRYRRNIEHARAHGVKVGSYHFFRTTSSIQRQFENFTRQVKIEEQDLVPLLDVETMRGWTPKMLRDSVKLFADMLEEHYGCRPMIYASSSFFNEYLSQTFADYPLFIARYAKSAPQLRGGANWILWQFSDRGRIKGIDAAVDLCRFNKGYDVNNILIRSNHKRRSSHKRNVRQEVPVPKPKPATVEEVKKEVPLSKKQRERLEKEQREKAEKAEKERVKKQRELAEKQRKECERLKKEEEKQRKEEEKRKKELDKKFKEWEKRREKEKEKERKEMEKEQREKAADRDDDLQAAGASMAAKVKAEAEQKSAQQPSAAKKGAVPARVRKTNKSSADNEAATYKSSRNGRKK